MKPATIISTLCLAFIAIAHVARFVLGVQVTVAGVDIPMSASLVAAIFFAGLAVAVWREHRGAAS